MRFSKPTLNRCRMFAQRLLYVCASGVGMALLTAAGLWDASAGGAIADSVPQHFTVHHRKDFPKAVAIGFNLADVSSVAALNDLPEGTKGILWMRNFNNSVCAWQTNDEDTAAISRAVSSLTAPNASSVNDATPSISILASLL